jgi:hypothetical protein
MLACFWKRDVALLHLMMLSSKTRDSCTCAPSDRFQLLSGWSCGREERSTGALTMAPLLLLPTGSNSKLAPPPREEKSIYIYIIQYLRIDIYIYIYTMYVDMHQLLFLLCTFIIYIYLQYKRRISSFIAVHIAVSPHFCNNKYHICIYHIYIYIYIYIIYIYILYILYVYIVYIYIYIPSSFQSWFLFLQSFESSSVAISTSND